MFLIAWLLFYYQVKRGEGKMIRKVLAACLALMVCVTMTACGGSDSSSEEKTTLVVGMECNYAPFNWTVTEESDTTMPIENASGYADGYDVQIAKMIAEEGLPPVSKEFYLDNFCFPVIDYYKKVGFDVSKDNYDRISKKFFDSYLEREKNETSLNEGIVDLLKELKKDGYNLYILTASEEKILIEQLKELGILEYFDGFSASKNIEALGKIDYGRIFIKENNINTNESIMIGDTLHDYDVAKALNLKPVLYSRGHNSKTLLAKTDAPIVDNFEDFYKLLKTSSF